MKVKLDVRMSHHLSVYLVKGINQVRRVQNPGKPQCTHLDSNLRKIHVMLHSHQIKIATDWLQTGY